MSGSNQKIGGKSVEMSVADNASIVSAKQHLALEKALQHAKDESTQYGMKSESQIRDILMLKYRAQKYVSKQEQGVVDEKRTRASQYEAAGREIDAERTKHREKGRARQCDEDKQRKEEFEEQGKIEERWAGHRRDTAWDHVKRYTQELVNHEKRSKEMEIMMLDLEKSAQYDVDKYRDEIIKQWDEDREHRIVWGRYQKEKKGLAVVDVEEDQDSMVEEVDCIGKSAKDKRSKEHDNKVKSSDKGDQANDLTSDDEVNDGDASDYEQPPPKRRAVGKENASRRG